MMTNRWLNVVLGVVVALGLVGVAFYERPRAAEERAELLDQDVAEADTVDADLDADRRDPSEGLAEAQEALDGDADAGAAAALGAYGVTAGHPEAVEVGMAVLEAGGNAVDAAIAVSYALGVVEPYGSGVGGGGVMLVHVPGEDPISYDYREVAPESGELPASEIGVPGFVAGMEHIHAEHGALELPELIEPAIRLAEDGIEVNQYLHDRLAAAAHRLPIHELPQLFPGGAAIAPGEALVQPDYAEALAAIQAEGAGAVYGGALGERIAGAVSGLELSDLEAYEVVEVEPATGRLGDYDVIGSGAPTSGPTVVQLLHIAEALGVADLDPDGPEYHHAVAQAWRLALADRTEHVSDPTHADVPVDGLLDPDYAAELASAVPDDGFVAADDAEDPVHVPETDTTHLTVVDRDGTMVAATNTLSNFFGSGLTVDGFFLNDQLKNFSRDPDSVNTVEAGKRPRSFIAPTIVARDGDPLIGLGSPGGRRIPMIVAQVVLRWAAHGQSLDEATAAARFHLEGRELYVEEGTSGEVVEALAGLGYEVYTEPPVTEFYGGVQALVVDHDAGAVSGVADERRDGAWAHGGAGG
jgi:gamma-glutamyltranspeptidase / glutathione hydrolase